MSRGMWRCHVYIDSVCESPVHTTMWCVSDTEAMEAMCAWLRSQDVCEVPWYA